MLSINTIEINEAYDITTLIVYLLITDHFSVLTVHTKTYKISSRENIGEIYFLIKNLSFLFLTNTKPKKHESCRILFSKRKLLRMFTLFEN